MYLECSALDLFERRQKINNKSTTSHSLVFVTKLLMLTGIYPPSSSGHTHFQPILESGLICETEFYSIEWGFQILYNNYKLSYNYTTSFSLLLLFTVLTPINGASTWKHRALNYKWEESPQDSYPARNTHNEFLLGQEINLYLY